ncbi:MULTISPECIES: hypothetical protein [unclassified Breznakia]|uniref:DUF6904 family protein n=1 Tax=unclassified Breznakia TaxID=2623764 RepID=UPI002476211C|nr:MULTISPECIES: hypothetical protein [unclassified Breznakia]MDH6368042.1 hypothetical protein [Breznakia sp. PH1-1]MDH6405130.1 hypothetical protein [Breznakia sp. PF1-11]MDH6412845.1 hypothetical protein [Breznakia sp. PFB1-11]MDH6415213.1 hypothetical protein [Breznakia sp. PFB1-14]MDH6417523.1 hypothetical protein [Breznakia sp. PFB1-4]
MITVKPTENLLGVTISGNYRDFSELVDAMHNITWVEDDKDPYNGVSLQVLGLCYDMRHAYQGDREITKVSEEVIGEDREPCKETTIMYSFNIMFPQAIFYAFAAPKLAEYARVLVTDKEPEDMYQPTYSYANYLADKGLINYLSGKILEAVQEVIGLEACNKLIRSYERNVVHYRDYLTLYVDRCNIEFEKTKVEKRPMKVRTIANRFIKFPDAYYGMYISFTKAAEKYGCNIYNLTDSTLEYSSEDPIW